MIPTSEPLGEFLLWATVAAPAVLLALSLFRRLRRWALAWQWIAPVPGLAAALFVLSAGPVAVDTPVLHLWLALDGAGALLLAAAALLWIVVGAGVFASGEAGLDQRFAFSWLLTMAGSLGVFVAGALPSFYFFYALVSIPAYGMIVTDERAETRRVGAIYMAFAILGEAFLLLAFVMLSAGGQSGSVRIDEVMSVLPAMPSRNTIIALVVIGFGMKMALAPMNGWMPLSYATGPIPAAAVLSGAAVKAAVIGLIRFLPFGAGLPEWSAVLMAFGFVSAFYGAVIGLAQRDPRALLGYSSISQMGVIAVALGAALASADPDAPAKIAFYGANHVLVKGALFLAIGAFAAGAGRRPALVVIAAALALSLAGLPFTGGALAKEAIKDSLGYGLAGQLANLSSAASALLMLRFIMLLRTRLPEEEGVLSGAPLHRLWPLIALGAIFLPWLLRPAIGGFSDALSLDKIWDGLWPILLGSLVFAALVASRRPLPAIPEGDTIGLFEAAFRGLLRCGAAFDRVDSTFRQWPAASLALVAIALALAALGVYSGWPIELGQASAN
jgi:formate hydrogenlyase subunit 3/multisubunit Na+/H+ antiporter MnhD subunit